MEKDEKVQEILKSIPWLKNPEELEFTAYLYYQALQEIKKLYERK